jgi:hypothetical protein
LPAKFSRKERDLVLKNQYERFHCLDESDAPVNPPLPPLLLDLRTPFGIPPGALYEQLARNTATRAGIVPPIYMHHLMHRFYGYQARVALPPAEEGDAQAEPEVSVVPDVVVVEPEAPVSVTARRSPA